MVARAPRDRIDWPFFERRHRAFAERLDRVTDSDALSSVDHHDVDAACRRWVRSLGQAGLREAAVAPTDGDASPISPSRCRASAPPPLARRDRRKPLAGDWRAAHP